MKHSIQLLLAVTLFTLVVSCGDEYNDYSIPVGKHIVDTDPSNQFGPQVAQSELEFPALKGGSSEVVVHSCVMNAETGEEDVNYSLEWDHDKKATRWVCYKMYNTTLKNNVSREDPWAYDPFVPETEQQVISSELSKSYFPGTTDYYQRGHILASADRRNTREANDQTCYMTNIYPMVGKFNGGAWSNMEGALRNIAARCDTLYVCKGGTIDTEEGILAYTIDKGHGPHIVPKYFWCAIMDRTGNTFNGMAFWFEHVNTSAATALKTYSLTIAELEAKTGINFFCNLPDDIENEVEHPDKTIMLGHFQLN